MPLKKNIFLQEMDLDCIVLWEFHKNCPFLCYLKKANNKKLLWLQNEGLSFAFYVSMLCSNVTLSEMGFFLLIYQNTTYIC